MFDFKLYYDPSAYCVGFGEVLFDILPSGPAIGGAPANFVYQCIQQGIKSLVISAVGADKLGFLARDLLAQRLIPALLVNAPYSTGCVNVSLDDLGVPVYSFIDNPAYNFIEYTQEIDELINKINVFCYSTLTQNGNVSKSTCLKILNKLNATKHCLKVYDVNLRCNFYSKSLVSELISYADIVKCNDDELKILASYAGIASDDSYQYYNYLKKLNINCLIVTQGDKQSTIFLNDEVSTVKAKRVEVVDTVGAGDAFTAVFIAKMLQGQSLNCAHQAAVEQAAYICSKKGAMPY